MLVVLVNQCTHVALNYDADVITADQQRATYRFSSSYPTNLGLLCGVTFWFYGGLCWSFLLMPFDNHRALTEQDARRDLAQRFGAGGYQVQNSRVTMAGWQARPQEGRVYGLQAAEHTPPPSVHASAPRRQAPSRELSPEEFEANIPRRKSKAEILYTATDDFPESWPRKWYYQTGEFKYWTIVGDPNSDPTESIANSKEKADKLMATEFPSQRFGTVPYETTHQEVKRFQNLYKSWRIVRVAKKDIAMQARR